MTVPRSERPTEEQMRHLIDHTEYRALSAAEHARLRAGFEQLLASQAGQRAKVDDLNRRLAAGTPRPSTSTALPARPPSDPLAPAATASPCTASTAHA